MKQTLHKLQIKNYRSLAHIETSMHDVNLLFGPNGAGKTTFLDAIWFIRDCAVRGVDIAASDRSHGIGLLWDQAEAGSHIAIEIEAVHALYTIRFGFSSGRIESFVGEELRSKKSGEVCISRSMGRNKAEFFDSQTQKSTSVELREPQKLALNRYLDFDAASMEASEIDDLLRLTRKYHARSTDLFHLRTYGSESTAMKQLSDNCENLWSVLRNLRDEREIGDTRYDTIIHFMQKGFPNFDKLYLEQQGANSVYGSFIEKNRRSPIKASGVSDGQLQLLAHLAALFCEGDEFTLILFDEPEISLHPYALAVFAEAVEDAATNWHKQIFIATHSPVLISQFKAHEIITTEIGPDGQTLMQRVSEMAEIQDLLENYAAGSLYMAELIAPQSQIQTL